MNSTPTPEDFAAVKKLCLEYEERLTKAERERNDAIHFQEQFAEDATAFSRQCTELRAKIENMKNENESWRCDSQQLERMVAAINKAMPDFHSIMGGPADNAEAALNKLCEQVEQLKRENDALCAFINRECQMTANDPRIQEIISAALKPN